MNLLTDFHHNSLLRSIVLLFENRLGINVYRPIGMDWYHDGFWAINNQIETAKQFLDIETNILPDNTPPLNIIHKYSDGIFEVYDPGNMSTHKAITLDCFKDIQFDYIIASIPEHIPVYQKLIAQYQPNAKLIVQIGNNWSSHLFKGLNVLASVKPGSIQDANVVYYHQEFDLNIFKPQNKFGSKIISSYINILHEMLGWNDFINIEEGLREDGCILRSYGGQCRDGNMKGPKELSDSMNNDDLVFHVKDYGDGYGHILYNAYACGKPIITRSSIYQDKLGGELIVDGTFVDLDKCSIEDSILEIKRILNNIEELSSMSSKVYNHFINTVNFNHDAYVVKNWLENL